MTWLLRAVLAVLVVLIALAGTWLVGMRRKWRPVVDLQRRINRAVVNPRQLRSAGTPGAYAGAIHHVGRHSGREYTTPMVPYPTDDGFVVVLPYGPRSDWVRNVLAAGRATIDHEGSSYEVVEPEVVPIGDAPVVFPPSDDRGNRVIGVSECLVLNRAP